MTMTPLLLVWKPYIARSPAAQDVIRIRENSPRVTAPVEGSIIPLMASTLPFSGYYSLPSLSRSPTSGMASKRIGQRAGFWRECEYLLFRHGEIDIHFPLSGDGNQRVEIEGLTNLPRYDRELIPAVPSTGLLSRYRKALLRAFVSSARACQGCLCDRSVWACCRSKLETTFSPEQLFFAVGCHLGRCYIQPCTLHVGLCRL